MTTLEQHYDVAIVGGAAMGSSTAYFLANDPDFDGSILVVERDPTYGACSTTRSWGGVRQQFSNAENIEMGLFGAACVKQAAEVLAVDGEGPDLGFKELGYLFLASDSGLPTLARNHELQSALGANIALLDPDELAARFPWLNTAGLAGGAYGLENEGWIDPSALLHGFRNKARALGATYTQDEVVDIDRSGARITGLRLRDGGAVSCGVLVNAAGPHAGAVAALAGIELPVRPRKRMTYVFDCRDAPGPIPLTIDCTGLAVRPEGQHYIAIISPPADQDADSDNLEPEYTTFEEVIWPTLADRIPAFEAIKLTGAWAGHYDYNTLDQNAVIGGHPEIANLYFCNGFSGHGIQQSPAAGRAVAELIVHGAFHSIDLASLSYQRILDGRPHKEANIV